MSLAFLFIRLFNQQVALRDFVLAMALLWYVFLCSLQSDIYQMTSYFKLIYNSRSARIINFRGLKGLGIVFRVYMSEQILPSNSEVCIRSLAFIRGLRVLDVLRANIKKEALWASWQFYYKMADLAYYFFFVFWTLFILFFSFLSVFAEGLTLCFAFFELFLLWSAF